MAIIFAGRLVQQSIQRLFHWYPGAVSPRTDHRHECIGHRQYPALKQNIRLFESSRIASGVEMFAFLSDHIDHRPLEINSLEHLDGMLNMGMQQLLLFGSQRLWLGQQLSRQEHLADVRQLRSEE